MMIQVNRVNDLIAGSVNGKPFSVTFEEGKYQEMLALEEKANNVETMEELKTIVQEFEPLTQESYKEIVETITPYIHVNKATNQFFLKWENVISSRPLPLAFADRLIKSVDKGIDILPLLKCWVRFQRPYEGKPAYSTARAEAFAWFISAPYVNEDNVQKLMSEQGLSREKAEELSTTTQVSITKEGLIVGYKVSEEVRTRYDLNENEEVVTKSRYKKSVDPDTGLVSYDEPEHSEDLLFQPAIQGKSGDAFWCVGASGASKGHLIRVGCQHYLESWDQVGPPFGPGLHFGGLNYIKGYQTEGRVTHNIFVDPADIHTVNMDKDGSVTCKAYFVFSSFKGVNKAIYHSSSYAAIKDDQFRTELEKLVKATEEKIDAKKKTIDEMKSLV
jgi:hypothetical protein